MDYKKELEEYNYILFKTEQGRQARNYLQNIRGILPATAKYWNLGFSPLNFTPECYKNEPAKFWHKLNGRIIIPIYDANGKLVSLSGRSIYSSLKPKYDHYPFQARKTLFGLYQNKNIIRNENFLIITEGQLDVISAWQKDVHTVVSSFGAHAGIDHLAIASRYTNNIYILYDNDQAGKSGLDMIEEIKNKTDLNISLCQGIFPKGEDLDSWIKKRSKEELYQLIKNPMLASLNNFMNKLINIKR